MTFRRLLLTLALLGFVQATPAPANEWLLFDADEGFVTVQQYFALYRERRASADFQQKEDLEWLLERRLRLLIIKLAAIDNQLGHSLAEGPEDAPAASFELPYDVAEDLPDLKKRAERLFAADEQRRQKDYGFYALDGFFDFFHMDELRLLRQQPFTVTTETWDTDHPIGPKAGETLAAIRRELAELKEGAPDLNWHFLHEQVSEFLQKSSFSRPWMQERLQQKEFLVRMQDAFRRSTRRPWLAPYLYSVWLDDNIDLRETEKYADAEEQEHALRYARRLTFLEGKLGEARWERSRLVTLATGLGILPALKGGPRPDLRECQKDVQALVLAIAAHYRNLKPDERAQWDAAAMANLTVLQAGEAEARKRLGPFAPMTGSRRWSSATRGVLHFGFAGLVHGATTATAAGMMLLGARGLDSLLGPRWMAGMETPLVVALATGATLVGYMAKRAASKNMKEDTQHAISYRFACSELVAGALGMQRASAPPTSIFRR